MFEFMMQRLREPSTWRGIIAFLTAAGVVFSPAQVEAIVASGLSLIGLVGVFTKDK